MNYRLLCVDDDPSIREVLEVALTRAGHSVELAGDGAEALAKAGSGRFDLIVLDVGLPERDGFEICRILRRDSDVPILFLTARDDEVDRIVGLELGADDYVTKPFSPRELAARVAAILKRTTRTATGDAVFTRGVLRIDPARHLVEVDGNRQSVTAREMAVLERLVAHPDQVLTRVQLVDAIYGTGVQVSDRTLDSHLRNLRAKLRDAGCPDAIETLHGVGLRMGPCTGQAA
ncbi:MAG: response regulator transcription factor [Pseudomonadota bacterium]